VADAETPAWADGAPANLHAAALDALEWLLLIERLHLLGRWKFSEPDSLDKLRGCIASLKEHTT
jgi:hypothetical protein